MHHSIDGADLPRSTIVYRQQKVQNGKRDDSFAGKRSRLIVRRLIAFLAKLFILFISGWVEAARIEPVLARRQRTDCDIEF